MSGDGWIQRDGLAQVGHRVFELPPGLQRHAQLEMGRREGGRQGHGLPQVHHAFVRPTQLPQGDAEVIVRLGMPRLEPHRGSQRRLRSGDIARPPPGGAEMVVGIEERRGEGGRPLERREGVGNTVLPPEHEAQFVERRGTLRIGRHGPLEGGSRRGQIAARVHDVAERHQRGGGLGVPVELTLDHLLRRVEPPGLRQGLSLPQRRRAESGRLREARLTPRRHAHPRDRASTPGTHLDRILSLAPAARSRRGAQPVDRRDVPKRHNRRPPLCHPDTTG